MTLSAPIGYVMAKYLSFGNCRLGLVIISNGYTYTRIVAVNRLAATLHRMTPEFLNSTMFPNCLILFNEISHYLLISYRIFASICKYSDAYIIYNTHINIIHSFIYLGDINKLYLFSIF